MAPPERTPNTKPRPMEPPGRCSGYTAGCPTASGRRPPPHAATIGNYPSYDSIPAMNTGRQSTSPSPWTFVSAKTTAESIE